MKTPVPILFASPRGILRQVLAYYPSRFVGMAVDGTRLHKTGRCIAQASYHRDPLSPPFYTNRMLGLRFLQASLLVPLHRTVATRALPVHSPSEFRRKGLNTLLHSAATT